MSEQRDRKNYGDVIDLLEQMELDHAAAKERIYKRLVHKVGTSAIYPNNSKEGALPAMKIIRKPAWTAAVAAAAVVLIGGALSTTAYAQEVVQLILGRFQVGNLEIVQVDRELPAPERSASTGQGGGEELPALPQLTLQEARSALGINFPAPAWVADFDYVNTVLHGPTMAEVQFERDGKTVNFLISQGGSNGIETTGEVTTETIANTNVYFANGIVIWEDEGFTVEMYTQAGFDSATLQKIIESFAIGAPLTQEQIDAARSELDNAVRTERAGPAPAAAERE